MIDDVLTGAARWAVVHGDALDVARSLPDGSVGLLWSDGPYGIGKAAWDRLTPSQLVEFYRPHLQEWRRVLAPNGSLYLCAMPDRAAALEIAVGEVFAVLNAIQWVKDAGWHRKAEKEAQRRYGSPREVIIFAEQHGADGYARGEAGYIGACDKARGFVFEPLRAYLDGERRRAGVERAAIEAATGTQMFGHWFSSVQWALPTARHYETLRRLFNGGPLPDVGGYLRREYDDLRREYDDLRREYDDLRREYDDLRRPFSVTVADAYTDVWTFPTVTARAGKHPCEKPAAMLAHVCRASTRSGMLVFDPFCGSGSMGRAAIAAGCRYLGSDSDATWATKARESLALPLIDGLHATMTPAPAAPPVPVQQLALAIGG